MAKKKYRLLTQTEGEAVAKQMDDEKERRRQAEKNATVTSAATQTTGRSGFGSVGSYKATQSAVDSGRLKASDAPDYFTTRNSRLQEAASVKSKNARAGREMNKATRGLSGARVSAGTYQRTQDRTSMDIVRNAAGGAAKIKEQTGAGRLQKWMDADGNMQFGYKQDHSTASAGKQLARNQMDNGFVRGDRATRVTQRAVERDMLTRKRPGTGGGAEQIQESEHTAKVIDGDMTYYYDLRDPDNPKTTTEEQYNQLIQLDAGYDPTSMTNWNRTKYNAEAAFDRGISNLEMLGVAGNNGVFAKYGEASRRLPGSERSRYVDGVWVDPSEQQEYEKAVREGKDDEYISSRKKEYEEASQEALERFERIGQRTEALKAGASDPMKFWLDMESTTLDQVPGFILGAATGGSGFMLPMAIQSFGSEYANARLNGATDGEAKISAALNAGTEILSEYLFSGGRTLGRLTGVQRGMIPSLLKAEAKEDTLRLIKSSAGRDLLTVFKMLGKDAGEEGMEEVVAGIIQPVMSEYIYGDRANLGTREWWETTGKEAIYAGLLGATLGAGGGVSDVAITAREGMQVRDQSKAEDLISRGLSMPEETTAYKLAVEMQNAKTMGAELGSAELGNLQKAVREEAQHLRKDKAASDKRVNDALSAENVRMRDIASTSQEARYGETVALGRALSETEAKSEQEAQERDQMIRTLQDQASATKYGQVYETAQEAALTGLAANVQMDGEETTAVKEEDERAARGIAAAVARISVGEGRVEDFSRFGMANTVARNAFMEATGVELPTSNAETIRLLQDYNEVQLRNTSEEAHREEIEAFKAQKTEEIVRDVTGGDASEATAGNIELIMRDVPEDDLVLAMQNYKSQYRLGYAANKANSFEAFHSPNFVLDDAQQEAAFRRGLADKKAVTENADKKIRKAKEKEAKRKAKEEKAKAEGKTKKESRVKDDKLSAKTKESENYKAYLSFFRGFSEKFGMTIELEDLDSLEEYFKGRDDAPDDPAEVNGFYVGGTLHINLEPSEDSTPIIATTFHEFTHRLEKYAPEAYQKYQDFVIQTQYRDDAAAFERAVQRRIFEYGNRGVELTHQGAVNEILADFGAQIATDEKTIRQMFSYDRSMAETIRDYLIEAINTALELIKGQRSIPVLRMSERDLKQARKLWLAAAEESRKNADLEIESGEQFMFVGYAPDGKGIYTSDYVKGTAHPSKTTNVLALLQDVWSKRPITLRVRDEQTGKSRTIQAQFDPYYQPGTVTAAGKISERGKNGNSNERNVRLNIAQDLYQILQESEYIGTKEEDPEHAQNLVHVPGQQWHYFLNNIWYQDEINGELKPYGVFIDVRETDDGAFVYSYEVRQDEHVEKYIMKKGIYPTPESAGRAEAPNGNNSSGDNISQPSDFGKVNLQVNRFQEERREAGLDTTGREYFENAKAFYGKYQEGTADETNYFENTVAEFTERETRPKGTPDYESEGRDGKVHSEYWYTKEGVIRGSDHWGTGIASCDWALIGRDGQAIAYGAPDGSVSMINKSYGFAKWEDFLYKTEVVDLDGERVLTSFANTTGKKTLTHNGEEWHYQNGGYTKYSLATRDADYLAAVERGDMETAQRMVDEAAERAGYTSNSDYQGTSAFNGEAPGPMYYESKEERKEAWDNDEYDDNQTLGDYADNGVDLMNLDFFLNDQRAIRNRFMQESISNLRTAVRNGKKTITMYRSVPSNIAEDSFRNGDWITPSRSYAIENAEVHGWGDAGQYRIIEQEVSIDDIWWDGNDINEWGYNDGTAYVYKNTTNNRKLPVVTYDDSGNVIPLSQRFDEGNPDIRFSMNTDSKGRTLTDGQREFFKDSKVRDENGNLKVMYHGTPNTGFTVFDITRARSSGTLGRGFYFSDSASQSNLYGDPYEVYLNIEEPLSGDSYEITKDQLRAFVNELAEDEDYGIDNYGYGATVDSVTEDVWGKSDLAMIRDLSMSAVGNMVEAVQLFNEVNGTNYDGIITDTETVVWEPDQIKDVTNKNPTEDPDIRFSISRDKKLEGKNMHDGKAAVDSLIEQSITSSDPESLVIKNAMYRSDIGYIDFKWGRPGKGSRFKGGYGLSHVIAKRNAENNTGIKTAYKIVEVIAKATSSDTQTNNQVTTGHNRIRLYFDGYTAVLSKSPTENSWLLTGWEDEKTATSAIGEVYDSTDATAVETTRFRRNGDATASKDSISKEENNRNPYAQKEQKQYSSTRDADYLAAIERGDIEMAQKMVDEAARRAGYTVRAYHGTSNYGFTVFDNSKNRGFTNGQAFGTGYYFTDNRDVADKRYANEGAYLDEDGNWIDYTPGVYDSYLKIENPLVLDWQELREQGTTQQELDEMIRNSYSINDAVVVHGVRDGIDIPSTVYVVRDSTAIKSADPVTYDNNGEIIPLSKRFDDSNPDIRFSLATESSLHRQDLEKQVERLKRDKRLTKGLEPKANQVAQFVRKMQEDYSSDYSLNESVRAITGIYKMIREGDDFAEVYGAVQDLARSIADSSFVMRDVEGNEEAVEMRGYFKSHQGGRLTLHVPKELYGEFDRVGGISQFRKDYADVVRLSPTQGVDIDEAMTEIVDFFGEQWDYYYSNKGNYIDAMIDAIRLAGSEDAKKGTTEKVYKSDNRDPWQEAMQDPSEWDDLGVLSEIREDEVNMIIDDIFEAVEGSIDPDLTFADRKKMEKERALAKQRKRLMDSKKEALRILRETKNEEVKAAKKEGRAKAAEVRANERERARRLLDLRREREQQKRAAMQTRASKRSEIRRVEAIANRLAKKLLTPSDANHVPERYRKAIAEMLASLDFESTRTDQWEERYGRPSKRVANFRKLREEYDRILKDPQLQEFVEPDDQIYEWIRYLEEMDGMRLADMEAEQVRAVRQVVQVLEHHVNYANRMLTEGLKETRSEMALEAHLDIASAKKGKGKDLSIQKFIKGEATPVHFFDRLGLKTFKDLYEKLTEAQDQHIRNLAEAMQVTQGIADTYGKKNIKAWSENTRTFTVSNGTEIELTDAQLMSLYALNKRDQARGHLLGAGVVVAPLKVKRTLKGRVKEGEKERLEQTFTRLTYKDVTDLLSNLSEEQIKAAETMLSFLKTTSRWGNETSMKLYGYQKFTEENYFPIQSAREYLNNSSLEESQDGKMKNAGFTKSTQTGASNPVVLDDFFDITTSHINQMSQYNTFVPILEDMDRVYHYVEKDKKGLALWSVKGDLRDKYGIATANYIEKLMRDVNGNMKTEVSDLQAMDQLVRNWKAAKIGLSFRVLFQQPTAVVRAMQYIDPKYFVGTPGGKSALSAVIPETVFGRDFMPKEIKAARDRMYEIVPLAMWKHWGYSQTDIHRSMRDTMMGNEGILDKVFFDMYGKADDFGWSSIFMAVERETRKENPELEYDSPEYREHVNKRFREIADRTQVVDSVLHRSEIMREQNILSKTMTAFMAEPTISINTIMTGFNQARVDWQNGNKATASKMAARTASVFFMNAVAVSLASSLSSAIRESWTGDDDDDDEKNFIEERLLALGIEEGSLLYDWLGTYFENDFTGNINPLNMLPITKDIISMMEGYDMPNPTLALPESILKNAQSLWKWIEDPTGQRYTGGYYIERNIEAIAELFGIPASNIRKEVDAFTNMYYRALGEKDYGNYLEDRWALNDDYSGNKSTFIDHYINAKTTGHDKSAEEIYKKLKEQGITDDEINDRVWNKVDPDMKQHVLDGVDTTAAEEKLKTMGITEDEIEDKKISWFKTELGKAVQEQDGDRVTELSNVLKDTYGEGDYDVEKKIKSAAMSEAWDYIDEGDYDSADDYIYYVTKYTDFDEDDVAEAVSSHYMSDYYEAMDAGNMRRVRELRSTMNRYGVTDDVIYEKEAGHYKDYYRQKAYMAMKNGNRDEAYRIANAYTTKYPGAYKTGAQGMIYGLDNLADSTKEKYESSSKYDKWQIPT